MSDYSELVSLNPAWETQHVHVPQQLGLDTLYVITGTSKHSPGNQDLATTTTYYLYQIDMYGIRP